MDQIVDDSVRRLDVYVERYDILGPRSNELTYIVPVLASRQIKATVLANIHIHYLPSRRQLDELHKEFYQFRLMVNIRIK